jgi:hypothetical protein
LFFLSFHFFNFLFTASELLSVKLAASGVQLAQTNRGFFHYHRAAFSSMLKSRVGNILAKVNLDGAPIASKSHTL